MKSLLFLSLSALAACAANASPQPQPVAEAPAYVAAAEAPAYVATAAPPDSVDCEIVQRRTSHGIELRAIASSTHAVSGEYELVITKRDRGGSSDIVQSGEFDLARGESASLGSAEISLERGGGYRARLELSGAEGATCVAERSR